MSQIRKHTSIEAQWASARESKVIMWMKFECIIPDSTISHNKNRCFLPVLESYYSSPSAFLFHMDTSLRGGTYLNTNIITVHPSFLITKFNLILLKVCIEGIIKRTEIFCIFYVYVASPLERFCYMSLLSICNMHCY